MSNALEPNRIHSLPVQVNYHLPSSSQSFTTIFSALQQVYVHPNAAPSRSLDEDEAWGSIYLKTVVQGVLRASPELHPSHPSSPDLSLYILDPRETYLRRSRASSPFPIHLRPNRASSPASGSMSPALSGPSYYVQAMQDVWTGKGLVTWALDEPGDGKNLITGRLVRNRDFGQIVNSQEMSPLEAMMMADIEGVGESWGIEISLGLRSGSGPPVGLHPQVQQVMSMEAKRTDVFRRTSFVSDAGSTSPAKGTTFQRAQFPVPPARPRPSLPSQPDIRTSAKVYVPRPLSPARIVGTTPHVKVRDINKKHSSGKRKKSHQVDQSRPRPPSDSRPPNRSVRPRSSSKHACDSDDHHHEPSSDSFPIDMPAQLYDDPRTLTKEQAERLIESPAFLNMLEKLTGQPIEAARNLKRAREDALEEEMRKKARLEGPFKVPEMPSAPKAPLADPQTVLKCYNCGRTKSAVWRMKVMEDGKSVRVCNACGLYWNKLRQMRPPTLWEGVDEDVKNVAKREKRTPGATPSSDPPERPAPRLDSGNTIKRTLSAVVEQDARRIASLRSRPSAPKSQLDQNTRAVPMTSPPRASGSTSRSVRNARWNGDAHAGASSPGGWAEPMHPSVPLSDDFNPVHESPNTAIRRILATVPNQSLDLPLSDDGLMSNAGSSTFNWDTDLSAFFDVDGGYSLDAEPAQIRSPPVEPTDFHRALSSGARRRREQTETDDDDILSQLFNRTSSVGNVESSPTPFDFSQLPPSSPPMMPSDLPHSALLLSSPDNSPMGFSPLDRDLLPRFSPEKGSSLKHSFTPVDVKADVAYLDHEQGCYDALHELLGRMQDGQGEMASSTAIAEGLVGGEDLLALLNSSFSS